VTTEPPPPLTDEELQLARRDANILAAWRWSEAVDSPRLARYALQLERERDELRERLADLAGVEGDPVSFGVDPRDSQALLHLEVKAPAAPNPQE
jgi:hypothetical protein